MKVKIIKCTNQGWWYIDYIYSIIDVDILNDFWYKLREENQLNISETSKGTLNISDPTGNAGHGINVVIYTILKTDCILLNREEKLKRILNAEHISPTTT